MKSIFGALVLSALLIFPAQSYADDSWHYYVLLSGGQIESIMGPFSTLAACNESLTGNKGAITREGLRTTACMQKAR